ncbi:MAG: flagellar motor stator protein MotA [Gammaproteobacteria bacterium]|nr:flagellar motor stator protein MotA [Gammaproteobacteria bacterium]
MGFILGVAIVVLSVFGGYILSHGHMAMLMQPYEFLIIAGAALGAFIIASPKYLIVKVLKHFPDLFKGSRYNKGSYLDLLGLIFVLLSKAKSQGLVTLESDVDEPQSSEVFQRFPTLLQESRAMEFMTDYLRLIISGSMNAHELENLMDVELDSHEEEAKQVSSAITNVADGLPGFGIVAAVLGVVITMSSLDQPPEILGMHIGAALVGTFLGILLAYGFVGPMGKSLEYKEQEEQRFLECIKICIIAFLSGYSPQITVEFGRKAIFSDVRPSFFELEEHVRSIKKK